ncbi:MAG: hypothetical protein WCE29_17020 [Mycobacterium sp.]
MSADHPGLIGVVCKSLHAVVVLAVAANANPCGVDATHAERVDRLALPEDAVTGQVGSGHTRPIRMRGFTLHTVVVGTDTMNPYAVGVHANDTRSVRRLRKSLNTIVICVHRVSAYARKTDCFRNSR